MLTVRGKWLTSILICNISSVVKRKMIQIPCVELYPKLHSPKVFVNFSLNDVHYFNYNT